MQQKGINVEEVILYFDIQVNQPSETINERSMNSQLTAKKTNRL